jgi:hypothetical protein
MENPGWGLSPALDTGPVFTCIVAGDPRLPEAAYPFLCDTLDRLLARCSHTVRIVYVWRTSGADHLAGRYARERRLDIYFVADRTPEILYVVSANAAVVFDGGGKESEALVRATREQKVALRVVDVRAFLTPAKL